MSPPSGPEHLFALANLFPSYNTCTLNLFCLLELFLVRVVRYALLVDTVAHIIASGGDHISFFFSDISFTCLVFFSSNRSLEPNRPRISVEIVNYITL